MQVTINVEYAIGDTVEFKLADPDGNHMQGVVVGYFIPLGEVVLYQLAYCDGNSGKHYAIELEKVEVEE